MSTNVPDRVVERDFAIKLANKVLENTALDPDGDLSVLARQFLRETERFACVRHENEEMRSALQAIASLGGKTLLGPSYDAERLHQLGAAVAFEQAAELARAALQH
jgi:hypothetical protein